jgi:integrase
LTTILTTTGSDIGRITESVTSTDSATPAREPGGERRKMTKKRGNGEGSIYKRQDGRWAAKYTLTNGKRKEVYGKTRKEVARKLAEAVSGREVNPSTEGAPKLREYLNSWLNGSVKGSVRERTFERYEEISRKHLLPELGSTTLDDLTPVQVQGLYRRRLDSGASPRTVQYMHATLCRALKQAVKWGLTPTNVAEAVTPPRLVRKEIKPLSPEQVQIFLKRIEGNRLEPCTS